MYADELCHTTGQRDLTFDDGTPCSNKLDSNTLAKQRAMALSLQVLDLKRRDQVHGTLALSDRLFLNLEDTIRTSFGTECCLTLTTLQNEI